LAIVLVSSLVAVLVPHFHVQGAGSLAGVRIDDPAPIPAAHFGLSVAGLGDIDGDATADLRRRSPRQGARLFDLGLDSRRSSRHH
jgi:hypothetical protein